jgi:gliding motility-associated protein GldE
LIIANETQFTLENLITFFLAVHSPLTFLVINPQATSILIIAILFLLIISFIVSGAQLAFFSLGNKDVNILKTKQSAAWKRIVTLLEEPKLLLGSLLIANTIANIAIIILSNFLIDQLAVFRQNFWLFELVVKMLIISFLILLFGEILPKVWASQNNLQFAYHTSGIIEIIHLLFKKVSGWMMAQSEIIEKIFGSKKMSRLNLEEINQTIDIATDNSASEEEKNILKGVIKFGNILVKQVMKIRLDVNGIDASLSFAALKAKIEELHYSRLPVYKNSLDEIVGMIHTKDLMPVLNEPADFDWRTLIRPPYFVHENKLIEDLLKEFQSKHIHFAIVVDEFGGTSGIITMEDILEEVIGEIKDEFDEEESINKQLEDGAFLFEGRTMIKDVCKTMQLPANTFDEVKGGSDSLAGLILELAGEIPKINDIIPCGDFEFTVLDVGQSRIKKVKVAIK